MGEVRDHYGSQGDRNIHLPVRGHIFPMAGHALMAATRYSQTGGLQRLQLPGKSSTP